MPQRVLLVETKDRTLKVTVPEGYRLTFGPLMPFESKASRYEAEPSYRTAIRIYRGKDDCVACIPGVVSFRELGVLKIEALDQTQEGEEVWVDDSDGAYERQQDRAKQVAEAVMTGKHIYGGA